MKKRIGLAVAFITLMVCAAWVIQADEKINKKDVPAAVITAFEKAYPNATVKGYGKEKEGGKTFYEIESMEGKMTRDILYNPDGSVAEIEEGVDESNLPQAVSQSIKKQYPKSVLTKAEKVTRGGKVTYEIKAKQDAKTATMTLDPNGKILENKLKEKTK